MKQKEYSIFFTLSIFLPSSPSSSLLLSCPWLRRGTREFFFFLRPNKNKARPRLRPTDRDVLGGFCVPAKTISKIYRKHLAESTRRSRGHQEVQGRYTPLHVTGSRGWGTGNGCGIPGPLEGKHTTGGGRGGGACRFLWYFPLGVSLICISVPNGELPVRDRCRGDPIKKVKGSFPRVCSRV